MSYGFNPLDSPKSRMERDIADIKASLEVTMHAMETILRVLQERLPEIRDISGRVVNDPGYDPGTSVEVVRCDPEPIMASRRKRRA